ncbi:sigma-70 family RNA polymerase sigma factor [Streptomyces sp. NBC_01304]|nr:sigma-70 family RNA polymerase sigma factor [Streptomyces sp. NBC_01304]
MTEFEALTGSIEELRGGLTGYCYRMLGSAFDAEDAVQETMVRAWRNAARFEGRSSLRTWVYSIAHRVCLDALAGRGRRATPMDLSGPTSGATGPGTPLDASRWIEPCPDGRTSAAPADPAEVVTDRESIRLAFVAALQHLPPKQRAVLLMREILGLSAGEVAELQDTSVASVNSALQRARSTLAAHRTPPQAEREPVAPSDTQQVLADRYAAAFAAYDMDMLAMLLHVDVTLSLPPYPMWMRGFDDVEAWLTGPAIGCRGSHLVPTMANGVPAFGQYRPCADGTGFEPWALQVLDIADSRIRGISFFRDTERLFPLFDLPDRVAA